MKLFIPVSCILSLAASAGLLHAHEHLSAGAAGPDPGAPLIFQNESDFGGSSGFVFNLALGATNSSYAGYYYADDLVFEASAATGDNGGPEPQHAGLGAHIQIKLLSVDGPAGAQFGFWETPNDGVDSTNLTWNVSVPYSNGTNLIAVSENAGAPGTDPYGHIHGRIYSATMPGLYQATWQFLDTSSNGPGGGPVNSPSAPFTLYFQAGLTLGAISPNTNGVSVSFAAPSNVPDENPDAAPTQYTLLGAGALGSQSVWKAVADPVAGDDHLHSMVVPSTDKAKFFRLQSQ